MAVAALLVVMLAPHVGAGSVAIEPAAHYPIQPGAPFNILQDESSGDAGPTTKIATLGFLFADGAGKLFVQVPAFQVARVGGEVHVPRLGRIGTVVMRHDSPRDLLCDARCTDNLALVLIDPHHYDKVSPAVRYWGGPTGVARHADMQPHDVVSFYGHAQGSREVVRARHGVLSDIDETSVRVTMPMAPGDNGGPFLSSDGRALATLVFMYRRDDHRHGTTVERALELAAAEGLHLRLLTAPLAR